MKIGLTILLFFQIGLATLSEAKSIRIATTANVHGETDPCG
tara:strand:+ start:2456 stop:2578 length:123 start_codon:yes stop_codon:yes gene_type:complete